MIVMIILTMTKMIVVHPRKTQQCSKKKAKEKSCLSLRFMIPNKTLALVTQRFPSLNLLKNVFPTLLSNIPVLSVALIALTFSSVLSFSSIFMVMSISSLISPIPNYM